MNVNNILRSDKIIAEVMSSAAAGYIWQKQVSAHHPSNIIFTVKPLCGRINEKKIQYKYKQIPGITIFDIHFCSDRSLTFNTARSTLENIYIKVVGSKAAEPDC